MTFETTRPSQLSDEQIENLLQIASGADTVELKLTVPEEEHRAATIALDVDPLESQIRQVFFFDTPDLKLNQAGIVVRARRVQGRGDDTVVKLRPVLPEDMDEELRKSPNLVVELDAMPGGFVCSASLKGKRDDAAVKAVFQGDASIRKLLTKEQRAFYADHAPEGLELDALARLGPINVIKLKFTPKGFERRMVAELWNYPDGTRLLELSTKCLPSETFMVSAESKAFLTSVGIDLSAEQQTKTRTALEFFSSELASGADN